MTWANDDLLIGPIPLWAQIAERLRAAVTRGEFVVGSRLPSEAELNQRFGVSRATARTALDRLETEGLITRRSGKGSIVCAPPVEQPLNLLSSFSDDMHDRGLKPGYGDVSVTVEQASSAVAAALQIDRGDRVVRVERLLLADGSPIAHSTSWLAPAIVSPDEVPSAHDLGSSPLYNWIESTSGVRVALGTEIIEGGVADAELGDRLGLHSGAAVLVARRTARAADGTVVEFVERQYRADRYRYRIELIRP